MKQYSLRDDQFEWIELLLPVRPGIVGRKSDSGNCLFIEAVIWKFGSGAPRSVWVISVTPHKTLHHHLYGGEPLH